MTCIAVAGVFRSGTSAAAGVLHHLGVFVGNIFDKPDAKNPKGYWEDLEFKALHQEMDRLCRIEGVKSLETMPEAVLTLYDKVVNNRKQNHSLWGVKDPLLCNYLPLLIQRTDMRLIVCRRPVEEIAASMGRSVGIDGAPFLPLVEHYRKNLDDNLLRTTCPAMELPFTSIGDQDYVNQIAEFAGVPVTQAAQDFVA